MKQQVKISKVKGNPSNPRIIKNDKFKKLVKSIKEFPEMLKLRPIVVDEDMIVLGGNMRLKASKDAGLKEVWIEVAEGLTEEQKKEFIVKDNVGTAVTYLLRAERKHATPIECIQKAISHLEFELDKLKR